MRVVLVGLSHKTAPVHLRERLSLGAPLNPLSTDTLYTQGSEGYVDYPVLAEAG